VIQLAVWYAVTGALIGAIGYHALRLDPGRDAARRADAWLALLGGALWPAVVAVLAWRMWRGTL